MPTTEQIGRPRVLQQIPLNPRAAWRAVRAALPQGLAIPDDIWARRHRSLQILLWAHVPVIFLYSAVRHFSLVHTTIETMAIVAWGVVAIKGPKKRRFQSVTVTLGLVSCSAVLVHISGGLIEFHFHYFVTLAAVSLYHDWAPFLTAIAFVAIQHGLMGAISPTAVYDHADAIRHPWKWGAIHAAFVLAASAISLVRWKSSEVEALKDPLTRLPNRTLFGDRLRQAVARSDRTGSSMAILFLDVDNFKSINDTCGHTAGDSYLTIVASRLMQAVRAGDTVARLGGDEFAIVLEDVDEATAVAVADRTLELLRAPACFEGKSITVSASIGIGIRSAGENESELVRNADIAMYAAKRAGKGRHAVFEPEMYQMVVEHAEIARDLKEAVEKNELELAYQPIVDLDTGVTVGLEALLRWNHPTLGMLPPLKFIPIAEDTGLIVPVGAWVIQAACEQARRWIDRHGDDAIRWISVNVSPRQLAEADFVQVVEAALHKSGLSASRLVLEITESAMVGDDLAFMDRLQHLKRLGVRIAIDDFGTGYSSLSYLRRLPIDILKIDRSFVDGIDGGPEDSALALAILKIAEGMGLECVAEGVERDGQAGLLEAAGCDLAQGFFFQRPVDAEHIDVLLMRGDRPVVRGRVMVVDDGAHELDEIHAKLRRLGFGTYSVRTAPEAIRLATRRQIDLLVLSGEPEGEISSLVAAVAALPSFARVPILALDDALGRTWRLVRHPQEGGHFARIPEGDLLDNVVSLLGRRSA